MSAFSGHPVTAIMSANKRRKTESPMSDIADEAIIAASVLGGPPSEKISSLPVTSDILEMLLNAAAEHERPNEGLHPPRRGTDRDPRMLCQAAPAERKGMGGCRLPPVHRRRSAGFSQGYRSGDQAVQHRKARRGRREAVAP